MTEKSNVITGEKTIPEIMQQTEMPPRKNKKGWNRDKKNFLFILIVAAFPLAQFGIFYVGVNINTVLMAFQTYDSQTGKYIWYGLNNFSRAWFEFAHEKVLLTSLVNSFWVFLATAGIGITLAVMFSFYIYKKKFLHNVFKVLLFLPSIFSAITMVLMYKYFVDFAVPNLWETLFQIKLEGLASSKSTAFATALFFTVWIGFGSGVLMYTGAMSGISESVVEAAQLDGAGLVQEFRYITVPMIFPTISTFIVVSVATFFVADMNLFSFYGTEAEKYVWTTGYYLLRQTRLASIAEYPYLACLGLIYTAVTLPIVFGVRRLLQKYGPSAD